MADANRARASMTARQNRALESMSPGTLGGRVRAAAPVPRRNRQVSVRPSEQQAYVPNVLLIERGARVPPGTPVGTVIVEKA